MYPKVEASSFSIQQIVTLASLIEREANNEQDRKLIAGVILNRLELGMRLDIDASVRFIFDNWSNPITQSQLSSSSPYNTRRVTGLPPGPICNPGLAVITAILNPTSSDYLYYLTDSDGVTHYATTLDQHNVNKAKYIR
ncbi:MAG: endolytic transglycosylase MltG [Patescibacteria group bacterium]